MGRKSPDRLRKRERAKAREQVATENYSRHHERSNRWIAYKVRDTILAQMGFESYQQYLGSEKWAKIRARAIKKNHGRCCRCGLQATQVHHSKYDRRTLSGQSLKHLWPVCRDCHEAAERSDSGQKESIFAANVELGALTKSQIRFWSRTKL